VYDANLNWRQEMGAEIAKGKEAVSALERMKAAGLKLDGDGTAPAATTPPPAAATGLSKEDIEKMLRGTESQGLQVMSALSDLAISHYAEFGERVKTGDIVAAAQKSGVDLNTAYNTMVSDRRAEKQKKEFEKQLADAEKRGAEKERAKQSAAPYPIGSMESGSSGTLAGITKDAARRAEFGVDAAVKRLNEGRRANT
jgi:DNA-binding transcriptional MerR regulator